MAKIKVHHDSQACTLVFKGNPKNPEPQSGIIKFPGGFVEVTRTTDNKYWAHLYIDEKGEALANRLNYTLEKQREVDSKNLEIPYPACIQKMSLKIGIKDFP